MSNIIAGNRVSLAEQVSRVIRQRVSTGLYSPGDRLPPVRSLSKEFGVSLNVVQRAIQDLQQSGLVATHVGRGMVILDEADARKAAILFGAIHPYSKDQLFGSFLAEYIHDALAKHSNFAVVQSSLDNASTEKRLADHLVANGARGLIVWPTTDDPNGAYFTQLAEKIPVVLVDRMLSNADLPAVLLDYVNCGCDIAQTLLAEMGCKRLLVLMDNLRISPYEEITRGLEDQARQLDRSQDVTIVQLPISNELLKKISKEDYTDVPKYTQYVERLIREGSYDAVFCVQDEFVDYILAQTHLAEMCKSIRVATTRGDIPNERSMMYSQLNCVEWRARTGDMLATAAEIAQEFLYTSRKPNSVIRIQFDKK